MDLLIGLAVIAIIVIVAWFILTQMALPEPIGKIVMIVLVVVIAVVAIGFLMNFSGGSFPRFSR